MKHLIVAAVAGCLLSASALAEKGESIMFGDPSPSLAPAEGDSGTKCENLLKEIDALKGKPQRRMAAQQRYDAECSREPGPEVVPPLN